MTTTQGTAKQGKLNPDSDAGDADSDADIDDLLARVESGAQANTTNDSPAPGTPASAAITGANQIPPSQIVIGKFLANGAFGMVYRGTWGDTDVALKKIDYEHARQRLELSPEEVAEALEWEVARLAATRHPNLVQFHGIRYKDGAPYLVLEFCHQGSLQNALRKGAEDGGPIPAARLWQWMLEISQALAYLHEQGMLHRDLKAENVLIDRNGRARLADLGVAQVDALLAANEASAVGQGLQDKNFIAPENIGGATQARHSSKATDIYALGVVFWQMVSRGDQPTSWEQVYQQDSQYSDIKAGERMPIPHDCPPQLRMLIRACWRARPAERASIADVLRQLREMAPAMHPEHALMGLAMHLEQDLHERREQVRHYVPCQVTLQPIEGAIEKYWERYEQHAGKSPMHNAPQALQTVFDDFLAEPGGGALLLSGEGGLGKTLSTCLLADRIQQQWWQHFADPAKHPMPKTMPVFLRSHLTGWTHSDLNNACADILARYGRQPGEVTPLVFVDGYDECRIEEKAPGNLARQLGLPAGAKLIITCRPGTVPDDQLQQRFAFEGKLQSCHYLSFHLNQLLGYLRQHLSWDNTTYRTYQARLQGSAELRAVLRNPFVLYLLWQSWETVSRKPLEQLTRADIYEGFIEHMVNRGKGLLANEVLPRLQANHATLVVSFALFANETALLAAEASGMTLAEADAHRTGSAWAGLEALVQRQAQQRYQARQAKVAGLSDAQRKEQSRRMVLTEEDFVRLQQQKATQLAVSLPLRPRAGALEFIHKSVFEHCLAQRLLGLLGQEDEGMTEEAMEKMLKWTRTSSPEALMMLHAGLEAREAARGASSAEAPARQQRMEARLLVWVAGVLEDRQLYASALECQHKALTIREKALGTDHTDTATSYNNIGALLDDQGKHAEALEYYRKALAIREKVLGTDHTDTAMSYNNIGALLQDQGKYAQGLEYYLKALPIFEKVHGTDHTDTAMSYNNLGTLLQDQGKYAKALEYFHKALAIWERILDTDPTNTASTYNNIGLLLQVQGKHAEALEHYRKALAIYEKALGTDHTNTATSYNNIGLLLKDQGKHAEAMEYFHKALTIKEKVFGTDHTETATSYNNIGMLLMDQGELAEALEYCFKTLAIDEKVFGSEHISTATSYNNIGMLLRGQGEHDQALEYLRKALDIREKVLGTDHTETANSYINMGLLRQDLGEHAQALEYFLKATAIKEKDLGTNHTFTAASYNNIGETLQTLGQNKEALAYYQKALNIAVALGDPDAQACYQSNIASLAKAQTDAEHEVVAHDNPDHKGPKRKKTGRTKSSPKKATNKNSAQKEDADCKNSGHKEPRKKDSEKCLMS